MDRVEEIEWAIDSLSREEFRALALWVREREHRQWDEEMDRDAASGKLDFLVEEAEKGAKTGLLREWPATE
jgi:hypothetical protein